MDMTVRQIRLLHGAAIDRERKQSASRIREVNAGMAGGEDAQKLIEELLSVRSD